MKIVTASGRIGSSLLTTLRDLFIAERAHWILWLPVALGIGIGLYFGLPLEPPRILGIAALALGCALIVLFRNIWPVRLALMAFLAMSLGFVVAQWRTHEVAATSLNRALTFATIEGRVDAVEPAVRGPRVVLDVFSISRLDREETPSKVRLRLHAADAGVRPGDVIRVRGRLTPPPSASYPGGYDFSRNAWFSGLGGVGFAFGPSERLASRPKGGLTERFQTLIASARADIADRLSERIEGPAGGVAAALATGLRGGIPEDVRENMRDSGLAHLLAISGLHIGLVAGFVFTLVRGGLALSPNLALRWPLKKIAAVAALLAAAIYMLLAGATVPTQRAFIMTAVVLVAMLLNRRGISLRLIALAATLVLLLRPEALLNVSFQMSFAATIALVAAYEAFWGRMRVATGESSFARRIAIYFLAVAFTTLIASLATAPFAVFHFNRLALLGIVANLVAVPVAALWVMPLEVLALLLMPFGLEGLVTPLLGWGVEVILATAASVSAWPLAAITVPAPQTIGLVVMTFGALWLTLWQGRWRLIGVVPVIAGLASAGGVAAPDIMIADNAKLIAFRSAPDVLYLSNPRAQSFVRGIWERRTGNEDGVGFPNAGAGDTALRCDAQGCIGQVGDQKIAFVSDPLAFEEDCRTADIVVAEVPAPRACRGPEIVVDWFDLWRGGAHAIWLGQNGKAGHVWQARVEAPARPWMRPATR